MSSPVLGVETAAWPNDEARAAASWRQAIETFAPVPEIVNDKLPQLETVARYVTTQFIVGAYGNEVPKLIQDPEVAQPITGVLRSIGDIKDLPGGWEARHRSVQTALNPNVGQYFSAIYDRYRRRPSYGDPEAALKNFLEEIAEGQITSEPWSSDAACKGLDPNSFFIEVPQQRPTVQQKEEIKERLIDRSEVCRGCSVDEACLEFGLATKRKDGANRIYGGKYIVNGRHGKLKVVDPFEY